jgi:hypothetical protein
MVWRQMYQEKACVQWARGHSGTCRADLHAYLPAPELGRSDMHADLFARNLGRPVMYA